MTEPADAQHLLPDEQIVFVDDSAAVLNDFRAPLSLATGGNAICIIHDGQSRENLIQEIQLQPFSLLLLDGNLAGGIRGWDVLKELRVSQPNIRCIGFSSDPTYAEIFMEAGAIGFVQKDRDHPWDSLHKIHHIIRGDVRSTGI